MISDSIFAYKCAIRYLSQLRFFTIKVFRDGNVVAKISEFLVEVGVLIFVFPILYTIIEKDLSKVTLSLIFWSIVIPVGCIFGAGVLSIIGDNRK